MKKTIAIGWFSLIIMLSAPYVFAADTIAGLGRIVPSTDVINLFGSSGDVIDKVKVKEGDTVKAGQILAYLESYELRKAELALAKLELEKAEQNLDVDIKIQLTKVSGMKEEYDLANKRLNNLKKTKAKQFGSPDLFEQRQLEIIQTKNKYEISKNEKIKFVNNLTNAVKQAEENVKMSEFNLKKSTIRSPVNGVILKALAKPGENSGRGLAFKVGNVETVYTIAEIYESDILRVRKGQKAFISSMALPKDLTGVVESIGNMIFKNSVDSLDPSALTGSRVVEVWIKLDQNEIAKRLIYLQVDVLIKE